MEPNRESGMFISKHCIFFWLLHIHEKLFWVLCSHSVFCCSVKPQSAEGVMLDSGICWLQGKLHLVFHIDATGQYLKHWQGKSVEETEHQFIQHFSFMFPIFFTLLWSGWPTKLGSGFSRYWKILIHFNTERPQLARFVVNSSHMTHMQFLVILLDCTGQTKSELD